MELRRMQIFCTTVLKIQCAKNLIRDKKAALQKDHGLELVSNEVRNFCQKQKIKCGI